jgi:hypothetical protein
VWTVGGDVVEALKRFYKLEIPRLCEKVVMHTVVQTKILLHIAQLVC